MIEKNKILESDLLDILFEDRNKLYGAYELRKKYGQRLAIAVASMIFCCVLLFFVISYAFAKNDSHSKLSFTDPTLINLAPEPQKPEQPLPPPPKQKVPPVKTIQFVAPTITNDDIKPDEKIPDQETLEDTKIANFTQEGKDDPDAIAPPIDGNKTGVIDLPKKHDAEDDEPRLVVQIESEYPGGQTAWLRYLTRTLPKYYTEDLVEKGIEGRVIVQFIVDKEGNVSDVQGISGPNELREIAVKVIMKSGKWTPAIQNGRQVKSYKKQPIVFVSEPRE